MTKKEILPSIKETAFNCPHCSALTTQFWFTVGATSVRRDPPVPFIVNEESAKTLLDEIDNFDARRNMETIMNELKSGNVDIHEQGDTSWHVSVDNLFLSKCYNCKKVAIWVHDRLMYPPLKEGPDPNQDLPDEIIRDFEEARTIVNLSPRGAAALLRLCVQKLCIHLKAEGENIDECIKWLVSKGLDPLIQRSLDIVRVIGNEAVHPGVIDLKDDRNTANELFEIINVIADQKISHPKKVNRLWNMLPATKKEAIEKRDKNSSAKNSCAT